MTTSVRIPEETQRRLDALAERTHRSRSFYLREAIERGLPQVEWEYDIALRASERCATGAVASPKPWLRVVAEHGLDEWSCTRTPPGRCYNLARKDNGRWPSGSPTTWPMPMSNGPVTPVHAWKGLTSPLTGLWRYRIGDWRVVVDIYDDRLVILALDIEHRSRVYRGVGAPLEGGRRAGGGGGGGLRHPDGTVATREGYRSHNVRCCVEGRPEFRGRCG